MAVPKQKQSHARTNKRRSTAQDQCADVQRVPAVPQPASPASRLPDVRDLRRPRGRCAAGARPPRSRPLGPGDLLRHGRGRRERGRPRPGRGRRRRGDRRRARRARRCCSARPRRSARSPAGVEVVDAPGVDRQGSRPRARRALEPRTPRSCASPRAVAAGEADALVSGGSTGAALAAGLFQVKRARGHLPPGARGPGAGPRQPDHACSTSAPTSRCAPSTSSSSRSWARRWRRRCSASSARASRCSPTARSRRRARRRSSRRTRVLADRAAGSPALEFVGNVEGTDITSGVADVIVTDGFTGNVALKLIEGALAEHARRRPRRRGRRHPARRSAARCCARRSAGCATRSTPRARAAPTCSACAGSASSRTGASRATASRRRSCSRRAGVPGDVVGRTHAALEAAGALRAPRMRRPPRPGPRLAFHRHDPRRGPHADPDPPRRRARGRPVRDRRGDALQGGSRGRFARPLHARPGARGHATA